MYPPLWGLTAVHHHLLQDPSPLKNSRTAAERLREILREAYSQFYLAAGQTTPPPWRGPISIFSQTFTVKSCSSCCILVLPSTLIKSTAFTLPKYFTISPLVHPFTHQWQRLTMWVTGQAIESNARFKASPKDTLTCGHEEPGITLSILTLKDDSWQHLYLLSHSRPVLLKLLAT